MDCKVCIELHTDNNNVIPTIITITSLLKNKNPDSIYDIRLLGNNLSSENIKLIEKTGVNVIPHESSLKRYEGMHNYVTSTDLFKFDLPNVLNDIDKVIYIDTDIIVQGDLSEFYNIDLAENYVGAVPDIYISNKISSNEIDRYFNAGVMLLNLKKMREDNISEKLVDYKLNKDSGIFMSQDALNYVFKDKILWLSPKYNYMPLQTDGYTYAKICETYNITKEEFINLKKNAIIIHFAGSKKPWQYSNLYGHTLWKEYFEQSTAKDCKILYKKIPAYKLFLHFLVSVIKKFLMGFGIIIEFPKRRRRK